MLACAAVYGYRFWTAVGLPAACFPFILTCQLALLSCNLLCHVGVLLLHCIKGGCNEIGAYMLNSVLNGTILLLCLNFYIRMLLRKRKSGDSGGGGDYDPPLNSKQF
ncbi:histone deacetylase [Orobanche gracilis]